MMFFDFARFALDYRVPVIEAGRSGGHHVREGWLGTRCPSCGGDHLGYSLERGYFACWRCGPMRLGPAVEAHARVPPARAWEIIREYGGGQPHRAPKEARPRPREAPKPPGLSRLSPGHVRYLESRGLRDVPALAEGWGLMGTGPLGGAWAWRIVAPVRDASGHALAYVGRSIAPGRRDKYRLTEAGSCAADPRGLLYGVDRVPGRRVLIVEGPADVWNVGPGAVATLGKGWHREQAARLRAYEWRGVMFDPEPEAQRRARALAAELSLFAGETEIIDGLPGDPGSLSPEAVAELRAELQL